MRPFTLNDIRHAVPGAAFDRGYRYHRERRARLIRVADDGRTIEGKVRGTRRSPYEVHIEVETAPHSRAVSGSCSCPVGYNCKHVAALLLEFAASPNGKVCGVDDGPLSADLRSWLSSLDDAFKTATDDYPPEIHHRLLYVLSLPAQGHGARRVRVALRSARLLKDGRFSDKMKSYQAENLWSANPAKYLRPIDRAILRTLPRDRIYDGSDDGGGYALTGESGAELLARMLATGRCYWQSATGPALALGDGRPAEGFWQLGADGAQQFCFRGGSAAVLPLAPPWYVEPAAGLAGPLETGLPGRLAATLLQAPPVPAGQVDALRAELAKRLPGQLAPLPRTLPVAERISAAPGPHLALLWCKRGHGSGGYGRWSGGHEQETVIVGRLSFDYDGHRIAARDRRSEPTFARDGRLFAVRRDSAAERHAIGRMGKLGFLPAPAHGHYGLPAAYRHDMIFDVELAMEAGWSPCLQLLHRDVPALEAEGWTVEIGDDFPVSLAEADDDWTVELEEGSGIDWVELHLGVTIDGQRVDLVPALCNLLRHIPPDAGAEVLEELADESETAFVRLEDGRFLPLPLSRLQPILVGLYELFAAGGVDEDGGLRFSAARAAELAALEAATATAAGLRWLGGERLRALGRKLRDFKKIEAATVPAAFKGRLRDYQQDGVDWLQFLAQVGLGGVLADDMGLGKTVQALAHLVIEKHSGRMDRPSLVVAPTSLMANWRIETARFAPGLKLLTLHGADRKGRFAEIPDHDLVLTTYPLLARDHEVLLARDWHLAILDEAQAVKNPRAVVTRLVQLLRARHRVCLTGTPMENHLGELWSLFHFLSPGLLGDQRDFKRRFRTPIEKLDDEDRRALLGRRVRPFLMRRTKSQVAAELPAKSEIVEHVEMTPAQRDLYESIRLALHRKVRAEISRKGLARSHIIVLDALLKLRQVCCDPSLVKITAGTGKPAHSAKLTRLMEMVPELLAEGRRILLFSQFTSMLALIGERLETARMPYLLLTGKTKDRATPVRRFQAGEVPLFLVSLKAGGVGLNLTAADTVIHYDPWWNPAVETQATDRAHRIGQDKAVFVHKLITLATIEEKMLELQARKRDLADGLFGPDGGSAAGITEKDIAFLFATE